MINEEILRYVHEQREAGCSDIDIKNTLTANGWVEADVAEILKAKQVVSGNLSLDIPISPSSSSIPNQTKPPRFVRILFWFIGGLTLVGSTIGLSAVAISFLDAQKNIQHFSDDFSPNTGFGIWIYFVLFVMEILFVIYAIALLRLRRWTVPVISIGSISPIITILLNISFTPTEVIGTILSISILLSINIVAYHYRKQLPGRMRKLYLQIPISLCLIPFTLMTTLYVLYPDDQSVQDADLILPQIAVLPKTDNAYYNLPTYETLSTTQQTALHTANVFIIDLATTSITAQNLQQAQQVVADTTDLTNAFLEAAEKPGYQCPTAINQYGAEVVLCELGLYRELASITALRAKVAAMTDDATTSIQTGIAIVRFGSLQGHQSHALIVDLVATAIMKIGLDSLQTTIRTTPTLSTTTKQEIRDQLEQLAPTNDDLAWAYKGEYMPKKVGLLPFSKLHNYLFEHNKTLNIFATTTRQQVALAYSACDNNQEQKDKLDNYVKNTRRQARDISLYMFSPNIGGRLFIDVFLNGGVGIKTEQCKLNTTFTQLQAELKN